MKKLFATSCALLLCGTVAKAADLPLKAPSFSNVPASWTGPYVGGQIGYGWAGVTPNDADVLAMFNGGVNYSSPEPAHGLLGGATIGYNYQMGTWLVGAEGDFSLSDVKGTFNGTGIAAGIPFNVTVDAHLHWLATARARLGYVFGRTLVYGTGGLAVARISGHYTATNGGVVFGDAGDTNTHLGWTAGGGVEYALTRHLSVKAEALYVGLDQKRYQNVRFSGQLATGRLGLNYRF